MTQLIWENALYISRIYTYLSARISETSESGKIIDAQRV